MRVAGAPPRRYIRRGATGAGGGDCGARELDREAALTGDPFATARGGGLLLRHRPELSAEAVLDALARHRANVERGREAVEHWGRGSSVSRVRLDDGAEVAVKWNHPRGLRHAIAEGLRGSRARRAVAGAARVRGLGLAAPRIVAWAERRSFAAVQESFLITGFVSDGEPLPAAMPRLRGMRAERRELARRLGEAIGRLHAAGLDHRDLKHSNLLRRADASLVILDLEAVESRCRLGLRRRVRALGQLEAYARDLYPWLPRTDRLRFLRAYLLHGGLADADRRPLVTGAVRWADARIVAWARRDRRGHDRFPLGPRPDDPGVEGPD